MSEETEDKDVLEIVSKISGMDNVRKIMEYEPTDKIPVEMVEAFKAYVLMLCSMTSAIMYHPVYVRVIHEKERDITLCAFIAKTAVGDWMKSLDIVKLEEAFREDPLAPVLSLAREEFGDRMEAVLSIFGMFVTGDIQEVSKETRSMIKDTLLQECLDKAMGNCATSHMLSDPEEEPWQA